MNTSASTTHVRTRTLIAAIALAGVLTACERTPQPPSTAAQSAAPSPEDSSFVTAAAASGRAEAEAGRVMANRAVNPQVRAFADRLDKDHTDANNTLERIAMEKGIALPQCMQPAARARIDELKTLSGAEADAAFLRHFGTTAHEDTIALFERQASSGQIPELRQFAADTVPKLREHLNLARQLERQLATAGGTR